MYRPYSQAYARRHRDAHPAGHLVRPAGLGPSVLLVACAVVVFGIVGLGPSTTNASAQAQSQYPIFNQENFVSTMKTVGQNFGGVNQAVSAGDFESAKSRAIRAREQLATTITLWRQNKKDDAVTMLRSATQKLDELDTLLSKTPVDKDAAAAAVKQVGGTCQACHAVYREQDPTTKAFRFKAGTLR